MSSLMTTVYGSDISEDVIEERQSRFREHSEAWELYAKEDLNVFGNEFDESVDFFSEQNEIEILDEDEMNAMQSQIPLRNPEQQFQQDYHLQQQQEEQQQIIQAKIEQEEYQVNQENSQLLESSDQHLGESSTNFILNCIDNNNYNLSKQMLEIEQQQQQNSSLPSQDFHSISFENPERYRTCPLYSLFSGQGVRLSLNDDGNNDYMVEEITLFDNEEVIVAVIHKSESQVGDMSPIQYDSNNLRFDNSRSISISRNLRIVYLHAGKNVIVRRAMKSCIDVETMIDIGLTNSSDSFLRFSAREEGETEGVWTNQ